MTDILREVATTTVAGIISGLIIHWVLNSRKRDRSSPHVTDSPKPEEPSGEHETVAVHIPTPQSHTESSEGPTLNPFLVALLSSVAVALTLYFIAPIWDILRWALLVTLFTWSACVVLVRRRYPFRTGASLLILTTLVASFCTGVVILSFSSPVDGLPDLNDIAEAKGDGNFRDEVFRVAELLGLAGVLGWLMRLGGLFLCFTSLLATSVYTLGIWLAPPNDSTSWNIQRAQWAGKMTQGKAFDLGRSGGFTLVALLGVAMSTPFLIELTLQFFNSGPPL